jgi:hypothetical protein
MIGHMIHMQVDLFNGRQLVQMLWLQATLIMISAHLVVYRLRSEARER